MADPCVITRTSYYLLILDEHKIDGVVCYCCGLPISYDSRVAFYANSDDLLINNGYATIDMPNSPIGTEHYHLAHSPLFPLYTAMHYNCARNREFIYSGRTRRVRPVITVDRDLRDRNGRF